MRVAVVRALGRLGGVLRQVGEDWILFLYLHGFREYAEMKPSSVMSSGARPFRHTEIRTFGSSFLSPNLLLRLDGPDTRRGPRSCAFG